MDLQEAMVVLHLEHGDVTTHQGVVDIVVVYTEKQLLDVKLEKNNMWINLSFFK